MSWSVGGFGKPAALAAKLAEDFKRYPCAEPEESIRQAAGVLIAAALAAQSEKGFAVKVEASGHSVPEPVCNTLRIEIEPVYGFVG